jgi:hypothetical protein
MKVKLLVVAVVVLAMASFSFAQALFFYNETWTMRKHCDGTGDPIPMNWPIWIMNDTDNDGWGPDSCVHLDDDPLGVLCDYPTDCEGGPAGTVNLQMIPMGNVTGVAGRFASDPGLVGIAVDYPRFYLKIVYCETTVVGPVHTIHCITYLSEVATMPASDMQEVDLAGRSHWACCEWDTTWSDYVCTPDLYTEFGPIAWPQGGPQHFHDCAKVCAMRPHVVSVGPLVAPDRMPWHSGVLPGCSPTNTPCDSDCIPAAGWTFGSLDNSWILRHVLGPPEQYWYDAFITPLPGATDGCICIYVDFILPAEIGEVAVVPLSNSVKITWRTLSETNLDVFAIYRDNVRIATKEAANTPSGASYEYVDSDLENGRTYTYDLRSVDINGAENSFHTASVTPSFENALVTEYALHQNYPNPFNPTTKIAFDLVDNNPVTLTVYNATGQMVATLIDGVNYTKGRHAIAFDSGSLTSGLYFYTVKIGNEFTATKKMLLVK